MDGLLALLRRELPRPVTSDGEFDDWEVFAPALVAAAANLFEGVFASPPPTGRLRAEVLARSFAEYSILFAWVGGAEDADARRARLARMVKADFRERDKAANKVAEIRRRKSYAHLFSPQRPGPLPDDLLSPETRERVEKFKVEHAVKPPLDTLSMAFAADERWMPEIPLVAHNPFALVYFILFTGPSAVTHPSIRSVDRMVVGEAPDLIVGVVEELGGSETPYGPVLLTFVNVLLIASRILGWPSEPAVAEVLQRDSAASR